MDSRRQAEPDLSLRREEYNPLIQLRKCGVIDGNREIAASADGKPEFSVGISPVPERSPDAGIVGVISEIEESLRSGKRRTRNRDVASRRMHGQPVRDEAASPSCGSREIMPLSIYLLRHIGHQYIGFGRIGMQRFRIGGNQPRGADIVRKPIQTQRRQSLIRICGLRKHQLRRTGIVPLFLEIRVRARIRNQRQRGHDK